MTVHYKIKSKQGYWATINGTLGGGARLVTNNAWVKEGGSPLTWLEAHAEPANMSAIAESHKPHIVRVKKVPRKKWVFRFKDGDFVYRGQGWGKDITKALTFSNKEEGTEIVDRFMGRGTMSVEEYKCP